MVVRSALVGNHDVGRYTLSFRAEHGAVVQPVAERTPHGETVLLLIGNVSICFFFYYHSPTGDRPSSSPIHRDCLRPDERYRRRLVNIFKFHLNG